MLSDPNVKRIMPKVGNRYESALALAKRARQIEEKRLEENDRDIHDAVDIAGEEIADGKIEITIDGESISEDVKEEVEKDVE